MSAPRIIAQIVLVGATIVGKAFVEAGKQAARNARMRQDMPAGAAAAAAGTNQAMSNSITDQLTRAHRMTLTEAQQILNVNKDDGLESLMKNYEHLFSVNEPAPPPSKPSASASRQKPNEKPPTVPPRLGGGSFYIQSKVVRARERIEAEWEAARQKEAEAKEGTSKEATGSEGTGKESGGAKDAEAR